MKSFCELKFLDVDFKDKECVKYLEIFYNSVYVKCFPYVNERETFENILKYLRNAENAKDYRYHIILVKK